MSQETQRAEIATKKVVYSIPGMDAVIVRRDVEYESGEARLTMDIYYPPDSNNETRAPAVVIAAGYPDRGIQTMLGCKFKDMEASIGWARLMAASGMAAIVYTNLEPARDIHALLAWVLQNASALGIDETRVGLWACSGNVPLALSVVMEGMVKCAALCYGFMFDVEGSTLVAEAAKTWHFANPGEGKSADDLPRDAPLLIVRAGRDETAHLNEAMDRFLSKAFDSNLPITVVNHASAPHAFDLLQDSEVSRETIRQVLNFLRFHLGA